MISGTNLNEEIFTRTYTSTDLLILLRFLLLFILRHFVKLGVILANFRDYWFTGLPHYE